MKKHIFTLIFALTVISVGANPIDLSQADSIYKQSKTLFAEVKNDYKEIADGTTFKKNEDIKVLDIFPDSVKYPVFVGDSINVSFGQEVYSDIKNFLSATAKALGTAVENVWNILVKQQRVYAIIGIIALLGSFFLSRFLFKKAKEVSIELKEADSWHPGGLFLYLLGIAVLALNATHIYNTISGLYNPEYGALMQVLEFIKSLK